MDPCVYTTQHGTWLRAAVDCSPTQLVCFRSVKRWKTASQLLTPRTTLPVLFRKQDETTPVLACRFVAELVEIHFADQFANDRERCAWLRDEDRLWLQRDTMIKSQSQFKDWDIDRETDTFMKATGERGVIGRGQVETQHPEDRRQEAFSLPQGHVEDEPERQRGFNGEIGILQLPATFADAHGPPSGDRIRGQPHGDITSLDQRSVVCRPIPDVVFCLVLWVHSRLHVEIMHLLSSRWPGGRSWLTEGAGSVHQRVCRESPVKGDKMP